MPEVAAAASWMETFHMPMREIEATYTRSELAIMAWRGSETAYKLRTRRQSTGGSTVNASPDGQNAAIYGASTGEFSALETALGDVAHKMVNKDGDVDLRQLTGEEAYRYMKCLGIPIGGRL